MQKTLFSFFIIVLISCTNDEVQPTPTPITNEYEIWTGPNIEFKKDAEADPNNASSQDEITSSVAITRGRQGEIYNAVLEDESQKGVSPLGTKWSIGDIADLEDLKFETFRTAVGTPQQVVGKKLVLYIEKEDVYLSVEFKSWTNGGGGSDGGGTGNTGSSGSGFSYIRSTKN